MVSSVLHYLAAYYVSPSVIYVTFFTSNREDATVAIGSAHGANETVAVFSWFPYTFPHDLTITSLNVRVEIDEEGITARRGKLRALTSFLQKMQEYGRSERIFAVFDAFDVAYVGCERDFMTTFRSFGKPIVFSAELGWYPHDNPVPPGYPRPHLPICSDFDFGQAPTHCQTEKKIRNCPACRDGEEDSAEFLNCGMFAGYGPALQKVLNYIHDVVEPAIGGGTGGDQAYWHEVYISFPDEISLDYGGALFFNLNGMPWSGFRHTSDGVVHVAVNKALCFVHANADATGMLQLIWDGAPKGLEFASAKRSGFGAALIARPDFFLISPDTPVEKTVAESFEPSYSALRTIDMAHCFQENGRVIEVQTFQSHGEYAAGPLSWHIYRPGNFTEGGRFFKRIASTEPFMFSGRYGIFRSYEVPLNFTKGDCLGWTQPPTVQPADDGQRRHAVSAISFNMPDAELEHGLVQGWIQQYASRIEKAAATNSMEVCFDDIVRFELQFSSIYRYSENEFLPEGLRDISHVENRYRKLRTMCEALISSLQRASEAREEASPRPLGEVYQDTINYCSSGPARHFIDVPNVTEGASDTYQFVDEEVEPRDRAEHVNSADRPWLEFHVPEIMPRRVYSLVAIYAPYSGS